MLFTWSAFKRGVSGSKMAVGSLPVPAADHEPILVNYEDHRRLAEPLLRKQTDKDVEAQQEPCQCGASFLRTCFNGLNALSGVGLLSVPYALAEGGWLSLVLLLLVAIICCYTGLLIKRCMDADARIKSYPDIGELAFGYNGRLFVSIFMYLELYLVAIGFLILEGDNMDKLFPNMSLEVGTFSIAGKRLFVVLITLVILPTTWLRSLGMFAYISAGGVLASIIVVASVLWAGTFDGVGFHERGRLLNLGGLPTSLGLYAFCYCGHAVFPTLCNSMKNKAQFSKVLIVCFLLCTVNYGSMAILGYLMYGNDVQSQVTLNLPLGCLSSKIAIYTTLINPFTKYALMVAPVATAIEERMLAHNKQPNFLVIRTLLVISTVMVALAIPFFGELMTLIGSFLSILVSMLLPCVCYLKISKDSRKSRAELLCIAGIMVFGVLMALLGTYTSLQQIIHEL